MSEKIDPQVWYHPEVRRALAARDMPTVYRLLTEHGVSQRSIRDLTGQSQSEVSEIIKGRRVMAYNVLVRIADGLGVPRGWMGLAYDGDWPPPVAGEEVDEDVERRRFLALAGVTAFGAPVFGAVQELAGQPPMAPVQPPARVGMSDVARLEDVNTQFRILERQVGGHAVRDALVANADGAERMLSARASDEVRARMRHAVADAHQLAGWASGDVGLREQCRYHMSRAIDHSAGDGEKTAEMLAASGHMEKTAGHSDGALKLFQLGQIAADGSADPQIGAVLSASSAAAYWSLDRPAEAREALRVARDGFAQADPAQSLPFFSFYGPGYGLMAATENKLGDVAAAHADVTRALETRPAYDVRCNALDYTVLATVLLNAGEVARGVAATRRALALAGEVGSRRVLDRLAPLEGALAARRDSTSQDLAREVRALRTGVAV